MSETLKLVHIITDLDTGGAEMMLYKLLKSMERTRIDARVISLTTIGPVGEKIAGLGIDVKALGMKAGRFDPASLFRLTGLIKSNRPELVQTWMYHADLFGGLAALAAGGLPTVWNIRNSNLDPKTSKTSTRVVVRINAFLSHFIPRKVLVCSEQARRIHVGLGYDPGKMILAPNGFDLTDFKPDPGARGRLRKELKLSEDAPVIGWVGRFDPQKDLPTLIEAAEKTAEAIADVQFVLCGDKITNDNLELNAWIDARGLRGKFHLLGRRDDISRLTAGFDLAVSSSAYGEAFSNVIGEAMACGVPCAATDVGDAAAIIDGTGLVVPPRESLRLAGAMIDLLRLPAEERRKLGTAARSRIAENYDLARIAADYEKTYFEVMHG